MRRTKSESIHILAPVAAEFQEILCDGALNFVAELTRTFSRWRWALLKDRQVRQNNLDAGILPDFLTETKDIREKTWRVRTAPPDIADRRVEITGPASSRKMVINALNSGANVYMADAEDSESPTWQNILHGQKNLRDAVRKNISFESPEGKSYRLNEKTAVLMFRPRGWHLLEKHVLVDGEPAPASLFDFGLYLYHNTWTLIQKNSGPYFYLPKLESYLEARLWSQVFHFAENFLKLSYGTIRATVLIETILAAFEMEEILGELNEHVVGLNCGRWDYIFSFIKKFGNRPDFVLPDRAKITMDKGFLAAYVDLLIATCHKRGAHAMGGMAAQIPIKDDPAANEAALEKVRADKRREVLAGCDGTWVAHPALVPVAREVFDQYMPGPNQLSKLRPEVKVTAAELLQVPAGKVTFVGMRQNINVAVKYMASWLKGNGCVPIRNLMEDAATAEICRVQLWQWVKHQTPIEVKARTRLDCGSRVDTTISFSPELFREQLRDELSEIKCEVGEASFNSDGYELAGQLLEQMVTAEKCPEFLTIEDYKHL